MLAFFNHWKENDGNVTDYLRELTTDYSKMAAEEVMRHQLRQDYPNATERQLEILYKKEVIDAYGLDDSKYTEEEIEEGKLLLEAKADKFRNELISKQEKFILPKPIEKQVVVDDSKQKAEQQYQEYKTQVNESPITKSLLNSKALVVGEGEDKLNFAIENPNEILDILLDNDAYAKTLFTAKDKGNGEVVYEPNIEKQLFIAAAAKDHKKLIQTLINHGKTIGQKQTVAPIDNIQPETAVQQSSSQSAPKSIAEAMARQGTFNSGGYR
jgi:hypothetical protein